MIRPTDVHSLTDFQRRTKEHLRRLKETGRPEVLTVNGSAEIVVQDARAYQELIEKLQLSPARAAIAKGIEQMERGEGRDAMQALEELRRELNLPPRGS